MARDKAKLQRDLDEALKSAQEIASQKALDPSVVDENDSMDAIASKIAKEVAKSFSEALAGPLANIIHDYGTDTEFIITGLRAPDGPVTGILKVKP